MLTVIKRQWVRIVLVLSVFALFLAKAVGLFDVALDLGPGSPTFPAVLTTPEFAVLAATGLVLSVLLPVLRPIQASALTLVAALPVFYLELSARQFRPLVPMEFSLLTILMLFVVNVLVSYYAENYKKERLIRAFGQYVPPEVVRTISLTPERFSLEGEARELSVMFCDIHNFTSLSEGVDPRELARFLNTLFTPLTRIIYKHRGTIDKYIGDSIMAFWGAPVSDPEHARNALLAAFEIQKCVAEMRPALSAKGWREITLGIGVNSGVMNVGNMGSEYRVAYTVVGDAVNLASRLQDLTRLYNAEVIVGEATKNAFPAAFYRELGLVQVKGKDALARIFQPMNPNASPDSTLIHSMNRHNQALHSYYRREWDEAQPLFETLAKDHPADPLYALYLGRIAEYRDNPPPGGWQGEIRYTVK